MKGLRLRTLLWKPRQEPLIVPYEQPLAARDHAKPLLLESPTLARQPAWVLRVDFTPLLECAPVWGDALPALSLSLTGGASGDARMNARDNRTCDRGRMTARQNLAQVV